MAHLNVIYSTNKTLEKKGGKTLDQTEIEIKIGSEWDYSSSCENMYETQYDDDDISGDDDEMFDQFVDKEAKDVGGREGVKVGGRECGR